MFLEWKYLNIYVLIYSLPTFHKHKDVESISASIVVLAF